MGPCSSAPLTFIALLLTRNARPAYALALQQQPCSCFSTCNPIDAAQFLRQLPSAVTDHSDPYYQYLCAVYGGPVPLPFDTSQLNFFYHNDATWRRRHPDIEWPMATCRAGVDWLPAQPMVGVRAGMPERHGATRCDDQICKRWHRVSTAPEPDVVVVVIPTDEQPASTTHGAVLFERLDTTGRGAAQHGPLRGERLNTTGRGVAQHGPLRGRQVYPDSTWVQVMRFGKREERENAFYGSWFFLAA